MKKRKLILLNTLLLSVLFYGQNTPIPFGDFNISTDIQNWTVLPNNVTKSWFNGGCQAMFVDNLAINQNATIVSSVFGVALTGDYELELDYGIVYTATAAVFELIDSSNNIISATSTTTVSGTCTDWPNSKTSNVIFTNLSSGNYQLKITIPKSQFFLDGASLGVYNPITISGTINDSSCSNGNLINDYPIKITNLSDNSTAYTTTSNGNYTFIIGNTSGNFLIEPIINSTTTTTPNSIALNITSSSNTYLNNDFCLSSTLSGVDVATELVSVNLARPGFTSNYNLIFNNNGATTSSNGTIVLNYDASKVTFQSASITPASTTSNSITWNYTNLTSLEIRNINIVFDVLPPPTVNSGDVLSFTGNSIATSDVNPVNNTTTLNQTVVNAYDPNDVLCIEGNEIAPSQISDYLTYRIRFQNTGTASAVNISVKTSLDANLDWTSFIPLTSSDPYTTSLVNGELTVSFNSINLADSTTNEPASHGWVFYKIKPKNTSINGDTFNASANIYFDFNPAIVTNTFTTTVVNPETYVPDDNFENYLETHDAVGNTVAVGDASSMGNGIANDDYVTTANINTVISLNIPNQNISNLTGIEGFSNLHYLEATGNNLTTVDISQNINLGQVSFNSNQLTSIDLSSNLNLTSFSCFNNQLTEIDLSLNTSLTQLYCVANTPLTIIKINNGNNTNVTTMNATSCPNLTCIFVDDAAYSTANWTNIDTTSIFVNNQAECDAALTVNNYQNNGFITFPNPIVDNIEVKTLDKGTYVITSLNGKSLQTGSIEVGDNSINVSSISSGLYLLSITTEKGSTTQKIIKE